MGTAVAQDKKLVIQDAPAHMLVEQMARVAMLVGLPADRLPDAYERDLIIAFLNTHYRFLEPNEIAKAFELALARKFEAPLEHYGQGFSPKYFANVLQPYIAWKREQAKGKTNGLALPEMTDGQKHDCMIAGCIEQFEKFKTKPDLFLCRYYVDLLNKMGINLLPPGRTWDEYLDRAVVLKKSDLKLSIEQARDEFTRRPLQARLSMVRKETVGGLARRLLLQDFFGHLVIERIELRDLINEKMGK